MDSAVVPIVVLIAAALHASWNAIAKGATDRFGLFAKASVVSLALGAVLCVLMPIPDRASWLWLAGSVVVHVIYNIGLMAAYQLGDFNQTYPLARGLGPLLVAIVAATLLGEPLQPLPTAGVIIIAVAIGVLGLTPWQRIKHNRPALTAAILTGLAIASYTLLDGIGVRRSESPLGYAAWLLALHGATTILVVAIIKRTKWAPPTPDKPAAWPFAFAAGVMSMLAYGLVLWAQAHGALASIAALRESSVVVAAIIGVVLFREPMGRTRIAASFAVAAGIVLLAIP